MLRQTALAFSLIFVSNVWAIGSQGQTQSTRQNGHTPQVATTKDSHASAQQERGTDQEPVVVKLVNTGKTGQEVSKEEEEVAEQTAAIVSTAHVTWVLAALTLALAAISLWQAILFNKEFNSTHRPKIRIKHVWMKKGARHGEDPITIDLVIVNCGDTRALIKTVRIAFCITDNLQTLPDRALDKNPLVIQQNDALASGVTAVYGGLTDGKIISASEDVQIARRNIHLICVGDVEYTDELGAFRKTAFYRYWNQVKFKSEMPYPDPDYEYQD